MDIPVRGPGRAQLAVLLAPLHEIQSTVPRLTTDSISLCDSPHRSRAFVANGSSPREVGDS
jgi:hypothetical protein